MCLELMKGIKIVHVLFQLLKMKRLLLLLPFVFIVDNKCQEYSDRRVYTCIF